MSFFGQEDVEAIFQAWSSRVVNLDQRGLGPVVVQVVIILTRMIATLKLWWLTIRIVVSICFGTLVLLRLLLYETIIWLLLLLLLLLLQPLPPVQPWQVSIIMIDIILDTFFRHHSSTVGLETAFLRLIARYQLEIPPLLCWKFNSSPLKSDLSKSKGGKENNTSHLEKYWRFFLKAFRRLPFSLGSLLTHFAWGSWICIHFLIIKVTDPWNWNWKKKPQLL